VLLLAGIRLVMGHNVGAVFAVRVQSSFRRPVYDLVVADAWTKIWPAASQSPTASSS
jgi:hypothetical protein